MESILSVEYLEGSDFIRVVFDENGGVKIREPLNPRGGDEFEGEAQDVSSCNIAHLMGFAYRCGQADATRKIEKVIAKAA